MNPNSGILASATASKTCLCGFSFAIIIVFVFKGEEGFEGTDLKPLGNVIWGMQVDWGISLLFRDSCREKEGQLGTDLAWIFGRKEGGRKEERQCVAGFRTLLLGATAVSLQTQRLGVESSSVYGHVCCSP
jgi:hypothetical protein